MKRFRGISLFASGGVGEMNLSKYIDFKLANELLPKRAEAHKFWHPDTEMLCGDITDDSIKESIISTALENDVDFVLATPPCQGVSLIGKNKRNDQFLKDQRNYLIFHALEIVDRISPSVVVIENVDRFLKLFFPYNGEMKNIESILKDRYKGVYSIDVHVYNSADYGVPQSRRRVIIVMCKDGVSFTRPTVIAKQITVRDAIGDLPSLESGESSNIKNHNARKHTPEHVECMRHTPTGKSAFQNEIYYPKHKDGRRITGYPYTYKRIDWDKPAPTITMRSDAISTTHTVHPGRKIGDELYSDARVLTMRELLILSSMNPDLDMPKGISESQVRYMIGEAVPPLLLDVICKNIKRD